MGRLFGLLLVPVALPPPAVLTPSRPNMVIRDIVKQFDQDKVVWDRQRFVEKALICDGE